MLYKRGFSCFPIWSTGQDLLFFWQFSNVRFFFRQKPCLLLDGQSPNFQIMTSSCCAFLYCSYSCNCIEKKTNTKTRTHFSQYLYNSRLVCQIFYKLHTYIHMLSMAIGRPGPVQDLPDPSDKEPWFLVVVQKPNCCQSHSSIFQNRLRLSTWGRQPQTSLDVDRSVCF